MRSIPDNVDYSLMERLSNGLLCSRCLKRGIRRPIRQMISIRHRVQSLCPQCRAERWAPKHSLR